MPSGKRSTSSRPRRTRKASLPVCAGGAADTAAKDVLREIACKLADQ